MVFSQYTIEDQHILAQRGDAAGEMIAGDGADYDTMVDMERTAEIMPATCRIIIQGLQLELALTAIGIGISADAWVQIHG